MISLKDITLNKNGFTLVELLVVIATLGIIFAASGTILESGFFFFTDTNQKLNVQKQIRFISNYISERAKYTNTIQLINSPPTLSSTDKIGLGMENSYFQLYTFDGSTTVSRKLSDVKLESLTFSITENKLSFSITNGNYQIDTEILLNNEPEFINSSGDYIVINK